MGQPRRVALRRLAERIGAIERRGRVGATDGWDDRGLMLADGRTVALPGLTQLPRTSEALDAVAQRGVEIDRAAHPRPASGCRGFRPSA